jgi:hypothetical protein
MARNQRENIAKAKTARVRFKDRQSHEIYEVSREFNYNDIKHFSLKNAANGNTLVLSEEGIRMRFASVG